MNREYKNVFLAHRPLSTTPVFEKAVEKLNINSLVNFRRQVHEHESYNTRRFRKIKIFRF